MRTSLIKCRCGRPATCTQCNHCVLHCHCPSPEELAAERRRQLNQQFAVIMRHIEANLGDWVWENRGEDIVWDGRRTSPGCVGFGNYLAVDDNGTIYLNRHWNDGRGTVEYNYGSRAYLGRKRVVEAINQLKTGRLIANIEEIT